jgi:NADH:ubiquinone reductase (H+-translocating)
VIQDAGIAQRAPCRHSRAGFAGFNAARELHRLARATTQITVINSADYFLYLPLMPQVTSGLVEPRHICVSLPHKLRKVRFVLGIVTHVDPQAKAVHWASPEGGSGQCGYDRLILTAGSVNKLLPIPGVASYAHGFRSIAEAIYLRDHIIRQLELAAVAADAAERQARCTFVVVGAGYTGTEVAAQGQLLTSRLAKTMPGLAGQPIRWLLLDTAPRVLPGLDPRLSKTADRVLRRRGCRGAHRPVGRSGPGWLGPAVHWREGAHPVADLVRRGPPRRAGG